MWLFGHELTHSIRNFDAQSGTRFYDSLKDILTPEGATSSLALSRLRDSILERYGEMGADGKPVMKELDDATEEEFYGDIMGYVLQDTDVARQLAEELERRTQGAGARFLQSVIDAIARACELLRKTLEGMDAEKNGVYQKYLDGMLRDYENKRAEVVRTLADFSERYRGSESAQDAAEERRYAFLQNQEQDVVQAFPTRTSREADSVLLSLAGKSLVNREQNLPAQINRVQRGKLKSDTALEKSIANGFTAVQHFTALANIESLYENAVLLRQGADEKNGDPTVIIRRFASPIVFGDDIADALLTLKETTHKKDSTRIYSLELTEIIKPSDIAKVDKKSSFSADGIEKLNAKHEKVKKFLEEVKNNSEKSSENSRDYAILGQSGAFNADPVAMLSSLQEAKRIEKEMKGESQEEKNAQTKQVTGWQRGVDGKWRYEISDDWTISDKSFDIWRRSKKGKTLGKMMEKKLNTPGQECGAGSTLSPDMLKIDRRQEGCSHGLLLGMISLSFPSDDFLRRL